MGAIINEMLEMMAGNKKTLEKYIEKEKKVKSKEGKFIVKLKNGLYYDGEYFITDKTNAVIYTNYDDASDIVKTFGGKVIKL